MEILPAKDESMFSKIENNLVMQRVMEVTKQVLNKREYKIICMRYGLEGERVHTQLEVAAKLNISRSYVSRIEKKAVEKLSKELKK